MMKRYQQSKIGSSVGLEITPAVMRAVEVKIHARETVIQRLAHGITPEGSVRDGQVVDPAALASGLRLLWEKGGFSTRRCGVAIPAETLAPQMLTVPPAPPAEQRLIVAGELARFAPVQSSRPFGWMPMGSGGGPGGNTLAFLADESCVRGLRQALAEAGLEMDACEPEAIAVLRAAELGLHQQDAIAVVHVSQTCSEMAFLEARRVRYYRRLDLGLAELADLPEWVQQREREQEDPELARILAGRESPAPPPRGEQSGELGDLVAEIKRSLQYYGRAYGSAPQPQKVFLLGDSPALERLAQRIHDELSLEGEYLHPLHLYPHAPGITDAHIVSAGGQYSVALGAALRPLVDPHVGLALDLRMHDDAQTLARQAPRYLMAALSGSTALALVALVASLSLGARLSHVRDELHAAEAELAAANAERAASVMHVQRARRLTDRLRKQALPVPQLLTCLGRMVPDALAITSIQLKEDGTLSLEGDARSPWQVNGFLQQLSDDSRFRSPNLDTLDANGEQGLAHFRVQTGLVGYGKVGGNS